jgi:hypothetical protein
MLKMKLVIDRLDKNGRLLEHREQPSRSFTRGLLELLYIGALQPTSAVPATSVDVDMVTRYLDLEYSGGIARGVSALLKMGAPCGNSMFQAHSSFVGGSSPPYPPNVVLNGSDLGIQVGVGDTVVTPTDRRLSQRIGHGRRPADGAPVVFESYTAGEDSSYDMNAATAWRAQEFIPAVSHRITSVWVKIYKAGAPGNLTVSIKGGDTPITVQGHRPIVTNCPDLAVGTILEAAIPGASPGALTQAVFATPIDVYAGHRYYIVCRAPGAGGANHVYWRWDTTATYEHAFLESINDIFARLQYSSDSGVTWSTANGACFMFEEWGQSVGEFAYGGCEVDGLTIADPNGSFTIRRYFTNNCGVAITVKEAGICAAAHLLGTGVAYEKTSVFPFLIARDVIPGPFVVVNNTEILRVTYVPAIVV